MARYVVPVVVLLAMVGGYVVGQQPQWSNPNDPEMRKALGKSLLSTDRDGNGVIEGEEFGSVPLLKMVDLNYDGKVEAAEIDQWVAEPARVGRPKGRTSAAGQVGRYVPFEGGKMLDTTNGTLYRPEGDVWVEMVKMREPNTDETASLKRQVYDALEEDGCYLLAISSPKRGHAITVQYGSCPSLSTIALIKQWADQPEGNGAALHHFFVDSEGFTPQAEAALDKVFPHKQLMGGRMRAYSMKPLPAQ